MRSRLAAALLLAVSFQLVAVEINLDYVAKLAKARAQKPFRSPRADLPDVLKQDQLDYDKYREIEFRREKALWLSDGLPYRIEFFHPGYLYQEPVQVNEFTITHVQSIRFVQDFFNYRGLDIAKKIPTKTGYAGFKLLTELNEQDRWDEVGSFLGASYFRLLGKGQRYGQSARGLAIDCGETDRGEEFPIFTDWWLGKPHREDSDLRLYAILDSVSCAGAYSFLIHPGESTAADIEAVLFMREADTIKAADTGRRPVQTLGFAPLTSMFWFGKNTERKPEDYRLEAHDSDGLLMHLDKGEILWRPLNNPPVMRHQRFATKNLRGYGLMQRERDFAAYQDLFNAYHAVPSVWVEPRGNWGEGDVHLVELPTNYEGLDNVVAFWNPKIKPLPLEPFRMSYTLFFTRENDMRLSPNKAVATRIGAHPRDGQSRQVMIDFRGPKLDNLPESAAPQAVVSSSENGVVTEVLVLKNTLAGGWRVFFRLKPNAGNTDPIDLRCTLVSAEENVSETWTYHWSPP